MKHVIHDDESEIHRNHAYQFDSQHKLIYICAIDCAQSNTGDKRAETKCSAYSCLHHTSAQAILTICLC